MFRRPHLQAALPPVTTPGGTSLLLTLLLLTTLAAAQISLPPLLDTNTENNSSWVMESGSMLQEVTTTWGASDATSSTEDPPPVFTPPPLKRPLFLDHPHLHPPGGQRRYGPYFEDGPGPTNVTARVGSTALLDCSIGMLQDKTVTWIQRKEDSIHLLTVGRQAYSSDARFSLNFRYPSNWRLQILFVSRRDEATYECQVATHPPRVRTVVLRVSAPELHVLDEHGHTVWDRYYKVGSRVELLCEADRVQEPPSSVEWRQGGVSLASALRNTSYPARPGLSVTPGTSMGHERVRTTLTLQKARREDSGNYTCVVADIAEATVAVHILNGELPAAVQHGTSGQAPVTPLLGLCVLLAHVATTCRIR